MSLQAVVEELQVAINSVRMDLIRSLEIHNSTGEKFDIYQIKDANGRYIMLDALVALADAEGVLEWNS